ncbi:MAG: 30S ribosomal protein S4e [Nitrososphaerales archaeon]
MGRKGEDKRTKRSKAPSFWTIHRKSHQFTVTTSPGPHGRDDSYPLAVLVRDVLKVVNTYREARNVIRDGKILVDGVVRRTPDFPVGLMDVLEIPILKKVYRMVPVKGSALAPVEIPDSEKNLKLCKVRSKTAVRGGKIQYGFHDGRSILAESETDLSPSDVCLLEVPSQKILRAVALKKGVLALAVKGRRAGKIGQIKELRPGTFTRPKMADLDIEGVVAELPADMVIAVGDEKPLVTVTGGA